MAAELVNFISLDMLEEEEDYLNPINSNMTWPVIVLGISHIIERKEKHRIPDFSQVIIQYSLDEFITMFKMSRQTVEQLCQCIGQIVVNENIPGLLPRNIPGGRPQIPLAMKVMMTVWYITGQEPYTRIADRFNATESTTCDATRLILQIIHDNLTKKFIRWPSNDEILEINSLYEEVHNFPGIVGFIDGTHIAVKPQEERAQDYYNRKDFYSVVLQAVVREDMRFSDVYCGWPGRVHDSRILRNSPLYSNCEQIFAGNNTHLLGDGGYPCLGWLLVPYVNNGHLTAAQVKYNKVHSQIRSMVERAFGVLKGRFNRLKYVNKGDIRDVNYCIISACVLHNMCILNGDEFAEHFETDEIVWGDLPVDLFEDNQRQDGVAKRLAIARRLYN